MTDKPNKIRKTFTARSLGQPRVFDTPEDMYGAFCEYIEHVDNNPWIKTEVCKSGDNAGMVLQVPCRRPYTLKGFSVFCNSCYDTLYKYSKREAFLKVYALIEDTCYAQKFDGAAIGHFNAQIIARDLGLVEKQEHKVEEVNNADIDIDGMKKMDVKELAKVIMDYVKDDAKRDGASASTERS